MTRPRKTTQMIIAACAIATAGLAAGATQQAPANNPVTASKIASPEKALRFEVTVPASLDDVWNAFTTKSGLETWLWKEARVEIKPGGDWLVIYPGGKTGGGTVISATPKHQLVIAALAPEQFPTVRKARTRATFDFTAVSPKATSVVLTQTGWQQGDEWDNAYEYLSGGNAQLLNQLYKRFVSGPLSWGTSLRPARPS